MSTYLKKIYQTQLFFPSLLGIFINPFYLARRGLCRAMMELAPTLTGCLLDVGCGTMPYKELFRVESYVGLDIDSKDTRSRGVADYLYDGTRFPFSDASFDSVLCNQVLEHVFNPSEFISEIKRVLKPGGKLLLTVPFVWDEHEQPNDYARYSSFGLQALLENQGLEVIQHKKIGADASIIFQLTNAYLFKVTRKSPKIIKIFLVISIMAAINFMGLLACYLLPRNPDLFLDHVVLAENA